MSDLNIATFTVGPAAGETDALRDKSDRPDRNKPPSHSEVYRRLLDAGIIAPRADLEQLNATAQNAPLRDTHALNGNHAIVDRKALTGCGDLRDKDGSVLLLDKSITTEVAAINAVFDRLDAERNNPSTRIDSFNA